MLALFFAWHGFCIKKNVNVDKLKPKKMWQRLVTTLELLKTIESMNALNVLASVDISTFGDGDVLSFGFIDKDDKGFEPAEYTVMEVKEFISILRDRYCKERHLLIILEQRAFNGRFFVKLINNANELIECQN